MAAGSTIGNIFKVTTWGESHGKGIGVVVDGCPAGLEISEEVIQKYLNRRKPGQTRYSTPRKEDDIVEIQSGVFEGKTTGTPISMVVYNKTTKTWGLVQNFSSNNKITWTAGSAGDREFYIDVKDASGKVVRSSVMNVKTSN